MHGYTSDAGLTLHLWSCLLTVSNLYCWAQRSSCKNDTIGVSTGVLLRFVNTFSEDIRGSLGRILAYSNSVASSPAREKTGLNDAL
ncbi:hypothetical protein CCHR01_09241 [Colletotrichum chrysophilum]|uniref:Secreted protein n=1 Tax=Colletotrichum chrysophilum TaxID=1836956 RepID=A0AAD9AJK9_9PEZI|nr:hypothetical protein CCHR01_09241 [Colletotrichum chrysophilum]